jgi:signal transduction histidine kinase
MKTIRRKKAAPRAGAGGRGTSTAAPHRKRERLAEALIAEANDRARGRGLLFSQLSHDLRNPLSVVLMSAQMLRRQLPSEHGARRYLDAVERASDELNQMLDELSDAARIEDRCLADVLKLEPVDLAALVGEAVAAARPLTETKQLSVTIDAAPGLAPVVGDHARIHRVLSCLVGGAVRITPKQGAVTVKLDRDPTGGTVVSVADTGPGVPEAHRASLFELPSGKIPGCSRRATPHGSALTLYVARHVVEAHGGSMTADHEGDSGTRYVVMLPHREVEAG